VGLSFGQLLGAMAVRLCEIAIPAGSRTCQRRSSPSMENLISPSAGGCVRGFLKMKKSGPSCDMGCDMGDTWPLTRSPI
jgi:hypothetical protein